MNRIASVIAALVLFPAISNAEGMALAGKLGITTGYGVELIMGGDSLSGRVGYNKYNYGTTGVYSGINFDLKLKLQSVSALADWYPFEGKFRISGGLYNNKSKIETLATSTGSGFIKVNGTSYPIDTAIRDLRGNVSFNPIAPYLGIGWGNPVAKGKGWGMVSDVGIIFQGSPKYSLSATCGPALTAPQCTTLQDNVAVEQTQVQNDLNKSFKYWPVISIGLTYQW